MADTRVVIVKIVSMSLVILVGWLVRRRGLMSADTTSLLSRFTTDMALPALVVVQMLETVTPQTLRASWAVPLIGCVVLVVGHATGWATWRLFCTRQQAPTFIFAAGLANWIYLPLPIVETLFGQAGVRTLLLSNAGVQVLLWTLSVGILQRGRMGLRSLLDLLRNPGLMATFLGLLLALFRPAGPLPTSTDPEPLRMAMAALMEALRALGSVTIPLSLILTGAQLGGLERNGSPLRPVVGLMLLRLLVAPVIVILIIAGAQHTFAPLDSVSAMVGAIVATMPVAVSCGIFVERFGQDTHLAARSTLYTTLASIATVPALFAMARWLLGT